ncbi:MAG: acetylglutamate kinase [Oligoflexales bacterium]
MKPKVHVVKIGGSIIDDPASLEAFLDQYADISGPKILVHGGGVLVTRVAEQQGIKQTMIDGRRVTTAETLEVFIMTLARTNQDIVAKLNMRNCKSIGLSGADGAFIRANKRSPVPVDYGFVGDIQSVDDTFLKSLLNAHLNLVVMPLSYSEDFGLLNTNADTIAQEVAAALKDSYDVHFIYCIDQEGVFEKFGEPNSLINRLDSAGYETLSKQGSFSKGMIPKLTTAFGALRKGVSKVRICSAAKLRAACTEVQAGTEVCL